MWPIYVQPLPMMISPTQFYKCLADDIRLKSLLLIELENELCVCELMVALSEESQPKVSRHLAQLRKCGLLIDRKQKQWVYYRINANLADWAKAVIRLTVQDNMAFLQPAIERLTAMGDRPERVSNCCTSGE